MPATPDTPNAARPAQAPAAALPTSRPLIFALVLLTPPLMILLWSWSIAAALALFLLAHAAILLPIFLPRLRWLGPVVTTFAPEPADAKVVWLTIDDGPDPADTPAILDLLDRYDARATFFLKGELAAAHPDVVKAMVDRGHQVQNHSQTHPTRFFWCAPPATVEREIRGCNAAIAGAGAPEPVLFRAPVGIKSPALHPVLGRLGMRLCAWSIRAFDGVSGFDPAAVEARVLGQLAPGAILCMHQGVRDRGGAPLSPQGLERVLAGLHERGYRCEIPALDRLR